MREDHKVNNDQTYLTPPSPTHEFSFTNINTTLQPPPPADDIFFHGHLLPLHPLPHLPDSPRSSTNSMDSFTLPVNLLYYHSNPTGNTSFHCHHQTTFSDFENPNITTTVQNQSKSKSFSISGIPKWKKRSDDETKRDYKDQIDSFKKLKLDLGQFIKRYIKMVKPLLLFSKTRRSDTRLINHQSCLFAGGKSMRGEPGKVDNNGGKRRGQLSAPASMRTSPGNSGVLVASRCVSPTKSGSESSMEELQAAIQAAIAHCKNSITMEDKIQSQNYNKVKEN